MARGAVARGQRVRGVVLHGQGAGTSGQVFTASVGRFVQRLPSRMRAVMIGAVLLYVANVVVGGAYSTGTPIDTGWTRASWVASIGARSNALPAGPRPVTGSTQRFAARLDALEAVVARWDPLTQPLYLQNNARHVGLLELGITTPRNPSTPSGWVGIADRQWPTMVATVTRSLRAEVGRLSAQNYFAEPSRAVSAGARL